VSLVTGSGSGIHHHHQPLREELSSSETHPRQNLGGSTPSLPTRTKTSIVNDNHHHHHHHQQGFEFVKLKTGKGEEAEVGSHSTIMSDPPGELNDSTTRFRVDRIHSSQLHNPPPVTTTSYLGSVIPEDSAMEFNTAETDHHPHYPNMHMQPRRSSLAQGLGGGRKKSVTLPRDFDYLEETNDKTVYGKNFAYYTREALPNMENYKNIIDSGAIQRPTLDELRSEAMYAKVGQHRD
jgi:hypothetical protein